MLFSKVVWNVTSIFVTEVLTNLRSIVRKTAKDNNYKEERREISYHKKEQQLVRPPREVISRGGFCGDQRPAERRGFSRVAPGGRYLLLVTIARAVVIAGRASGCFVAMSLSLFIFRAVIQSVDCREERARSVESTERGAVLGK
ncbi:hypothetical protein EVAR_10565_1 [Eumeta japonica]|uniref:Uncharacterized protein n=1 Tax=Eumeta variegata TaxID=151549 RepID=A0A4C1U2L6_EUMVA|nr:hypothetical protein EVAR_10565_1 [Eumeta japonica]